MRICAKKLLPEILRCLDQAVYIDGEAVREFENSFAAYCETPYCVALASGTAALHLALLAWTSDRAMRSLSRPIPSLQLRRL